VPPSHDLEPDIMSDEEKRQRRRFDAAFVFEMMPPMVSRAQFGNGGNPLRTFELED
jgi:hypothetical protein